ncbi:MAG: hypothetical protein ACI9HK_003383 [Pirellulaceae bacterium]|jgi:hypothetical protein
MPFPSPNLAECGICIDRNPRRNMLFPRIADESFTIPSIFQWTLAPSTMGPTPLKPLILDFDSRF